MKMKFSDWKKVKDKELRRSIFEAYKVFRANHISYEV